MGLAGGVGVGHIIAVDFRRVVGHRILGDAVLDFRAVRILGKAGKTPIPTFLLCHRFGVFFLAVGQQVDGDARRAVAVLVIVVIPGLGTRNGDGLRRVGDDKTILHIAGNFGFVPGHRDFLDGILDFAVIIGLGQVRKLAGPAAGRGQLQRLFRLVAALAPQFNRDALRVVAVRVVLVGPDLLDRNADLCIGIFVGDLVVFITIAAGVGDAVDLQLPGGRVLAYLHGRRDSARFVGPAVARRGFLDGIDVAARFLIRDRVKDGFAIRCAVRCRRIFRQRGAVLCRDGKRKHAIRQRRQRAACSGHSVFVDPERGVRALRIGGNTGDHDRHLVGSNGQFERFAALRRCMVIQHKVVDAGNVGRTADDRCRERHGKLAVIAQCVPIVRDKTRLKVDLDRRRLLQLPVRRDRNLVIALVHGLPIHLYGDCGVLVHVDLYAGVTAVAKVGQRVRQRQVRKRVRAVQIRSNVQAVLNLLPFGDRRDTAAKAILGPVDLHALLGQHRHIAKGIRHSLGGNAALLQIVACAGARFAERMVKNSRHRVLAAGVRLRPARRFYPVFHIRGAHCAQAQDARGIPLREGQRQRLALDHCRKPGQVVEHLVVCRKDRRAFHIAVAVRQGVDQIEIAQKRRVVRRADGDAVLHPIRLPHNRQGVRFFGCTLARLFGGRFFQNRGFKGPGQGVQGALQPFAVLFHAVLGGASPGLYPGGRLGGRRVQVRAVLRHGIHPDQHIEGYRLPGLDIVGAFAVKRGHIPDDRAGCTGRAAGGQGRFQRLVVGCKRFSGLDFQVVVIAPAGYKDPAQTIARRNQADIRHAVRQHVFYLVDRHRVAALRIAYPDPVGRIVARAQSRLRFAKVVRVRVERGGIFCRVLRDHVHIAVHGFQRLGDGKRALLHTGDGDLTDRVRRLGIFRTAGRNGNIRRIRQVRRAGRLRGVNRVLRHGALQHPRGRSVRRQLDGREYGFPIFCFRRGLGPISGGLYQRQPFGQGIVEREPGVLGVFAMVGQRDLVIHRVAGLYRFGRGDLVLAGFIPVDVFRQRGGKHQVAGDARPPRETCVVCDGKGRGDARALFGRQVNQRLALRFHRHVVDGDLGKAGFFVCGLRVLIGHFQGLAAVGKFIFHNRAVRGLYIRQHKYLAGPPAVVDRRGDPLVRLVGNGQRIHQRIAAFAVLGRFAQVQVAAGALGHHIRDALARGGQRRTAAVHHRKPAVDLVAGHKALGGVFQRKRIDDLHRVGAALQVGLELIGGIGERTLHLPVHLVRYDLGVVELVGQIVKPSALESVRVLVAVDRVGHLIVDGLPGGKYQLFGFALLFAIGFHRDTGRGPAGNVAGALVVIPAGFVIAAQFRRRLHVRLHLDRLVARGWGTVF